MSRPWQPTNAAELAAAISGCDGSLELVGGASKREFGRPVNTGQLLELSGISGISLYEPEELVLTAGAGTRLSEIQAALDAKQQMLAFEPPDLGPLYGRPGGESTLGGLLACNLAGPRRVKAGSARDHFLGCVAVNGLGEIFKTGGRVVKNVTGYDLCKLLAGSFGTLAAIAEVTLKVLPAPEHVSTLLLTGMDEKEAVIAMNKGLGSAAEVSAAAHLPREQSAVLPGWSARSATLLRLEGTATSVADRMDMLRRELGMGGEALDDAASRPLWWMLRDVAPLHAATRDAIWRLSVPPASSAAAIGGLQGSGRYFLDWGGGLIWLALPAEDDAGASRVRRAIASTGGHATLMRAPASVRAAVEVFQPQDPALAALTKRVKKSFDPYGRLNPGRMYSGL
jgi:glycolate oxidase FAD binding subunit